MSPSPPPPRDEPGSEAGRFPSWEASLRALCQDLATLLRAALRRGSGGDGAPALDRPAGRGAGDVTYGIDLLAEERVTRWLEEEARRQPLSVLTEDAGWRHRGPDGRGGVRALDGFDHGGPRIAFDPVDGTRNLMADLRSAWVVVSFAGAGPGEPRLSDLEAGLVAELPTTRECTRRVLTAERGGPCRYEELALETGGAGLARPLAVDGDDRPDHGYFPFFRYQPALRPRIAAVEADFLARLERAEGADPGTCYDDQYVTSAGQMVLLALGTYRVVVDARPVVAGWSGIPTTTAKPYDVAGAILVARAAGAVVTDLEGEPLDFPLDCTTPVAFAGWANPATRRRLLPHLRAALWSARG